MKKCKHCQSEIDGKATRCPHCQADLRSWFRRHPILSFLLGFIIFVVVVGSASGGKSTKMNSVVSKTETSQVESQAEPTVEPTKEPEDPNPHFEDGVYRVGEDIKPGTYRTRTSSANCYYLRLRGFGGSLDEIIASENTSDPAVVTIAETDKGFKSTRCGVWTQDLSAITESKTSFGDGIFVIGTDVEPGTYKNTGQDNCYYLRLSGFGGEVDEILSSEITDDPALVTIDATDKGFKSVRCGTWTKI